MATGMLVTGSVSLAAAVVAAFLLPARAAAARSPAVRDTRVVRADKAPPRTSVAACGSPVT
jgi:hypothetical protein